MDSHLDFAEVQRAARALGEKRREARRAYEEQSQAAADADRDYRRVFAVAFTRARAGSDSEPGRSVAEAEALAASEAAEAKHRRDIAQSLAKSALLRIEELEADRAMLRQLGDWSQRIEGVAA